MFKMNETVSIHERRRRAPLHFLARAENARFSSFLLWKSKNDDNHEYALEAEYGGSPSIALEEAFRREAALSLEFIIKASIAQQIESDCAKPGVIKVRPTHDLVSLWEDAQLPILSTEDQYRLLVSKRILYWSGRYAAPLKDKDFDEEKTELLKLADLQPFGSAHIIVPRSFSWDNIDRIFQLVVSQLLQLRREHLP